MMCLEDSKERMVLWPTWLVISLVVPDLDDPRDYYMLGE